MIEKQIIDYALICDMCAEEINDFDTFTDAVNFKKDKDNGWRSKKENGNWIDLCPDCAGSNA